MGEMCPKKWKNRQKYGPVVEKKKNMHIINIIIHNPIMTGLDIVEKSAWPLISSAH
jgi:hypothetical protein